MINLFSKMLNNRQCRHWIIAFIVSTIFYVMFHVEIDILIRHFILVTLSDFINKIFNNDMFIAGIATTLCTVGSKLILHLFRNKK